LSPVWFSNTATRCALAPAPPLSPSFGLRIRKRRPRDTSTATAPTARQQQPLPARLTPLALVWSAFHPCRRNRPQVERQVARRLEPLFRPFLQQCRIAATAPPASSARRSTAPEAPPEDRRHRVRTGLPCEGDLPATISYSTSRRRRCAARVCRQPPHLLRRHGTPPSPSPPLARWCPPR